MISNFIFGMVLWCVPIGIVFAFLCLRNWWSTIAERAYMKELAERRNFKGLNNHG